MRKVWKKVTESKSIFEGDGPNLRTILLFIFTLTGFSAVPAFLQQRIFDLAIPSGNPQFLLLLLALLLGAVSLTFILEFLVTVFENFLCERINYRLRINFILHLLGLESRAADTLAPGDLNKIQEDLSHFQKALRSVYFGFWRYLVSFLIFLPLMLFVSWKLSLLRLAAFPLGFFISQSFSKKDSFLERSIWEMASNIDTRIHETLHGRKIIKSFSAETQTFKGYRLSFLRFRNLVQTRIIWSQLWGLSLASFQQILGVLLIYTAAVEIMNGALSVGQFLAFQILANQGLMAMNGLQEIIKNLWLAKNPIHRIEEFYKLPKESGTSNLFINRPDLLNITFVNLTFGFSVERPVFKNLNFMISAGIHTAIVGPSGSGKTTLALLLLGLYQPQNGRVSFSVGDDLYHPRDLRAWTATVMQEPFLFQKTIKENLTLGRNDILNDEIINALKNAGALEFVSSLPQGIETPYGAKGTVLSGGQRQRLALARIWLQNPALIILDEATSALDNEGESNLEIPLKKLREGRTSITIAHRLSTIRHADEIIFLESGTVVERGNHQYLFSLRGRYFEMVMAQESAK